MQVMVVIAADPCCILWPLSKQSSYLKSLNPHTNLYQQGRKYLKSSNEVTMSSEWWEVEAHDLDVRWGT